MQYNDYESGRKNLNLNFLLFDVPRKQTGNKFSKEKIYFTFEGYFLFTVSYLQVESSDLIGSQIYTYEYQSVIIIIQ